MTLQRAVVLVVAVVAGTGGLSSPVPASEEAVTPAGAYPFALPGFAPGPTSPPKALLWCQGEKLLGLMVPDEGIRDCGPASQKKPRAILLRDGRCRPDGSVVSFGFLISRTTWVVQSAADKPEGQTMWLLNRFEGSLKEGVLSGVLVQVDVSHPGQAFERKNVAASALAEEQTSFADEGSWRGGLAQRFCVAADGP